jgi:hypothetical protein
VIIFTAAATRRKASGNAMFGGQDAVHRPTSREALLFPRSAARGKQAGNSGRVARAPARAAAEFLN